MKDLLTSGSGNAQLLSNRVTSSEEPAASGGGPQGKADTGTGPPASAETPPPATKPEPGVSNLKIINDNTAFATTPLRRYFDIVWLPDFEEQYVVQGKPGLGNSDITVTTGHGWSLQGLEAKIDNSALVKPLLELYSNSLKLLEQVGRTKLGVPPIQGGAPQGKTVQDVVPPGTQLSIKITKVRVVAPGLYPLLKPKEYAEATKLLQDKNTDRVLVPLPPLTNIAFNTYDTLVVEAARTTGDSALRIHQYVDTTLPSGLPPPTDRAAQIKTQEGRLNATQTGWKVSLREEAGKIKAVAEKDPSATNALAQDQVKANIKGAMGQIGATIDDADIVFK